MPASDASISRLDTASAALARRIGPQRFDMWFGGGTRLELRDDALEVITPSPYAAEWIKRHFTEALQGVAADTLGLGDAARIRVRAVADAPGRPRAEGGEADASKSRSETSANSTASERPDARADADGPGGRPALPRRRPSSERWRRLDDFVVGPSNTLAFEIARRTADGGAGAERMLFLHGECGVGKTHLLQGICRRRHERSTDRIQAARVRYTTGEQFTNEFIAAVRGGSVDAFRRRFRGLDVLAIDDVHFLSNKTATQGEFLHTLDAIGLGGATVVLASDEHPRQIGRFNRSLVSRFLAGMVVELDPPDRETRRQLLRRLLAARGFEATEAAEEAIVGRYVASARELEGVAAKLTALSALDEGSRPRQPSATSGRMTLGMVLVERLLEEDRRATRRTPVRLGAIVDAVASAFDVGREDLLSASKHRAASEGRGVVVMLARRLTTLSYPEIARGLGRRNHSAIHAAERRIRTAIETGDRSAEALRERIDRMAHELVRAD
ncbi:MAG: DnaA ATPase domain-containing protein [Phycisphaerales bacterium]|jgi:chromosomal replication initiator protein